MECVANETLLAIRDAQPAALRGTAFMVPVLEGDGTGRIGRFGWKSQHASLESFAADAYLNEMGITNPLFPDENTSSGRDRRIRHAPTIRSPTPRTTVTMSSHSPISCGPRRRRHEE